MRIDSIEQFRAALAQGPYAWPGGYPCFFLCEDGGALAFDSAQENERLICAAIQDGNDSQWRVVGFNVNWEDPELFCAHSGKRIESAYAEDSAP